MNAIKNNTFLIINNNRDFEEMLQDFDHQINLIEEKLIIKVRSHIYTEFISQQHKVEQLKTSIKDIKI